MNQFYHKNTILVAPFFCSLKPLYAILKMLLWEFSESGKPGQVVMFLHDPDKLEVIADIFDEYLEKLIRSEFNWL